MTRQEINNLRAEAQNAVSYAMYKLRRAEACFNDTLTDDLGRSVETEYNSIYDALASLKEAQKALSAGNNM